MKTRLPKFKHAKVMVVGDIMLDRYWHGLVNRISSEAPTPVVRINTIAEHPGGAANVAMNIASLGADVYLIGLIGNDNAAHILKKLLTEANVKYDFITVSTHQTITKLRVLSHNQQLIRLDFEDDFTNINVKLLYEYISNRLNDIDVLVLSDYAKGTLTNIQQIIILARKANIPVLVDPRSVNFELYRGATLITPNFSEFEAVVGKCNNEDELVTRGINLMTNFEFSSLLVTRAEHGMTLLQPDKAPLHMLTKAQKVYDVTGAGDTVIGVLAATLAAGNSLEEACYLANIAAGTAVGKLGTSTVSLTELEYNTAYDYSKTIGFGIMSETTLKIAITAARKRGEKIVMTNGVFDIIHAGHIAYLTKARNLGDRLIVALNNDASVRRLKGNTRPINSLKQRMIVLSALKIVDWVVSFADDTPKHLIADIKPDLLVKGGDYYPWQIAGCEEVWSYGGQVIVLNLESGYSTTNIINKIQKNHNSE